jgi:hypothetical protein
MTEVWFRNPTNYVRELVEEQKTWIAWDRGILIKRRMDPDAHAKLYFGRDLDYRLLLVGAQGTAELRQGYDLSKPYAVYPTWEYEDSTAILEELVTQPVGEDEAVCQPGKLALDETPVFGQEHRIVITNQPAANTPPGRRFLAFLKELQEDYPDVILHLHGVYSWRVAFGIGLASADIDPRVDASKGRVVLPTGRNMPHEQAARNPKWITVLGFKPVDLKEPRNRCRYNIRSAAWAGENFMRVMTLPTERATVDPDSAVPAPQTGGKIYPRAPKEPGDKFVCNTCSVQDSCSYFREGAVCAVPGSEPVGLSQYFKTRNSGMILEGLGTLMAVQTRRLEQGLEEEEFEGLKPEVTKIIKDLFNNGVTLAKLVDPGLRDPKLAINVGPGGTAAVINGTPAQAVSAVIRALEMKGIQRHEITSSMVENLLESMKNNPGDVPRIIEGTVVADRDERTA